MDLDASSVLRDLIAEAICPAGLNDAARHAEVERAHRYALRVIDSNVLAQQHGEDKLLQDLEEHFRNQRRDSTEFKKLARQLKQFLPEEQRLRILEAVTTLCMETRLQMPSAADGLAEHQQRASATQRSSFPGTLGLSASLQQNLGASLTHGSDAWSHLSSDRPSLGHVPTRSSHGLHDTGDYRAGDAIDAPASLEGPLAAVMTQLSPPLAASMSCNSEMVQDIIHACQGIDGRLVQLSGSTDSDQGYHLTHEGHAKLSVAQKSILLQLCELGWLYRRVRQRALPFGTQQIADGGGGEGAGKLHQAFAAAVLHHELKEFYRLMAVLQAMALRPAQTPGAPPQEGYLTPRRLAVWLLDPLRRMRTLARLADACLGKRGGQLANVVHAHTLTGDLFTKAYVTRILRLVCVPMLQMINKWVFEGELDDPFGDFFVVANNAPASESFDLWRDGYTLCAHLVPTFVSEELARKILRAGKSINFLRQCCDDVAWVQENATKAMVAVQADSNFDQNGAPIEMLHGLVDQASAVVDQRLKTIMLDTFGFKRHCLALKQYMFFSQGDFVSALLHQIAGSLAKKARDVSELELTDKLKKAVDASNSKFHEDDVLDRLRVKKAPPLGEHDRGWDVFCLKYQVRAPLSTLLTPDVMKKYEQISTFLWKLKHVEYTLQQAWVVLMKIEATLQRSLRSIVRYQHPIWLLLSKANHLRSEMSNFCQNLQTYIMYEVLEGAWHTFQAAIDKARDVDEVLKAQRDYQHHITEQSLMDGRTERLRRTLAAIFDSCHRLLAPLQDCCSEVQTAAATLVHHVALTRRNVSAGEWGASESVAPIIHAHLSDSATNATGRIKVIKEAYEKMLAEFTAQLSREAGHVDLRFLLLRMDYSDFYRSGRADGDVSG